MTTKASILVVDDSEVFLRGWCVTLENAGYQVKIASTGEEAINMAKDEKPDIVITDLVMPGMNGVE
ncbi:MAG TPA: response regulator, partial [Nitrospirae bacterium]|nr:response regulator [Nitrospirota bacterium]